ncbi:MAG: glycosyltransferase [Muribaculum sp.]|nr:glycosyltransferase [Muribaculum sp.]
MVARNSYKVSVIVPIYGVEPFVERCVESLLSQTLSGVEYIFVDDCTPDDSIGIVRRVIERHPDRALDCRILQHDKNWGLPAARNTGMAVATGEYVYHCDSDDFLEHDMLEQLYSVAKGNNADMVWSDWYLSFGENERYMSQPEATTGRDALSRVLEGSMKYNVWNKLTRKALFNDNGIEFPAGRAMGEDMTMIRIMACAGRTAYVNKALYHYVRTNTTAMTQTYSERHLSELKGNVAETERFLLSAITDNEIDRELALFKLNVKLPFLFTGKRVDIERWREWYPETNRDIMSNRNQSLRTRILQWCASKGMSWINLIYTHVVFKFVYGKLYR